MNRKKKSMKNNIEKQVEELETKFRTHCADQVSASGGIPNFSKAFIDVVTPFTLTIQKETVNVIVKKMDELDGNTNMSDYGGSPKEFVNVKLREIYKQMTGEDYKETK